MGRIASPNITRQFAEKAVASAGPLLIWNEADRRGVMLRGTKNAVLRCLASWPWCSFAPALRPVTDSERVFPAAGEPGASSCRTRFIFPEAKTPQIPSRGGVEGIGLFRGQWPRLNLSVACLICVHWGTDEPSQTYQDRKLQTLRFRQMSQQCCLSQVAAVLFSPRGDVCVQSRYSHFGVVAAGCGQRQYAFALQPVRSNAQRAQRQSFTFDFQYWLWRRCHGLRTRPLPRSSNATMPRTG